MAIRGVIFDLGSTLIHRTGLELEREKCAALAAYAAATLGARDPGRLAACLLEIRLAAWRKSEEEQTEILATRSIAEAFEQCGLPADEATVRTAETVFFEPEVQRSRLYPSAVETLDTLAEMGLRLGMISNATSHRLVVDIAEKHKIAGRFNPLVTSAAIGRTKPHASIFTHVLDAWRVSPGEAVMIGDNLGADILGANTVGMRAILVDIEPNPDNPRFADTVKPAARVTDLREVLRIIRGWNGAA